MVSTLRMPCWSPDRCSTSPGSVGVERRESQAKRAAARTAAIFAPFFLAALAGTIALVVSMAREPGGGPVVGLVVLAIITLLTGHQTIQPLRDALEREPRLLEGKVSRAWSRADLFLFRSYYVLVERQVFRIEPEDFFQIDEGDRLRVLYYPHANTVEQVERLEDR